MTIDVLPDVALLRIFDLYVDETEQIEDWQTLVHVCRNWRYLVFQSPRRSGLKLHCTCTTPIMKKLDVWPPLPIVLLYSIHEMRDKSNSTILAALEHVDRICEFDIYRVPRRQLENILAAMQQPFPALTHLYLRPEDETAPIIPDSFLSGSAPRLRTIYLDGAAFPGLPKLLLSATHLVILSLEAIPHSGYFSPEAMAIGLSSLTRLERLHLEFRSPQSRPDRDRRRPRPSTCPQLPVLTHFTFMGASEYLEDLVARIDTPILNILEITFFRHFAFDTSQLAQFISRTPRFKTLDKARVDIYERNVWITLPQGNGGKLELGMSFLQRNGRLSSLAQLCSLPFVHALFSTVEQLYIQDGSPPPRRQDDIDNNPWLEVLHPFIAIKSLCLSRAFVPRIADALQILAGESVTEVLPALRALFLDDPGPSGTVQENIGQFVAARQFVGHSIAVSLWKS